MNEENKDKFLRVIDSSCTAVSPERIHTIRVNGEKLAVAFRYGEETILPFEQGVKFMIDGFRVEEVDGSSLSLPAVAPEHIAVQLDKDQCVAKFSELTLPALKLRAAAKPGGEIFLEAEETDKSDVIAFLMGEPPAFSDHAPLVPDYSGEDTDEIDLDEDVDADVDLEESDKEGETIDAEQADTGDASGLGLEVSQETISFEDVGEAESAL